MTEHMFQQIMDRLDIIEGKLELQANPSKFLAISEKSEILRKALATGDKAKLKEATRRINGK